MNEKKNTTLRQRAKDATRQAVIEKARAAFTTGDYNAVTIRQIVKSLGVSMSAVYNSFDSKEELFEAAMGFPPPVDGPLTRAAPALLKALVALLPENNDNPIDLGRPRFEFCENARNAITLATSPLDGEAWSRHLSAIRRDEPHTLAAGEPAASVPSGAAGDQ